MKGEINMSKQNLITALLLAGISWAIVILLAVLMHYMLTSFKIVSQEKAIQPTNITGVY
jgi:hypothetical protein